MNYQYVIDLLKRGATKADLNDLSQVFGQAFGEDEEAVEAVRELVSKMYDFDFDETEDWHGLHR